MNYLTGCRERVAALGAFDATVRQRDLCEIRTV